MSNYTRFPNWLIDEAMPNCSPAEWAVVCVIARKTIGWDKTCERISLNDFMSSAGIKGRQHVTAAINSLLEKGYIVREADGQWFNYSLPTSNLKLPVTLSNQLPYVTSTSNLKLPEVVTLSNQFTPVLNKDINIKERDHIQTLAEFFTQCAGILPGRSNYTEDWEIPLSVILNGGDVEKAKQKIGRAIEFARNPENSKGKRYTIRAPASILTIISNLPGEDVPESTIKVRSR